MNNKLLHYLAKLAAGIDRFSEITGKCLAWMVVFLVLLVSYDVTMRYMFQSGSIALQELEWHIFSIIFLLGAAYTFKYDDHVRLDMFYHSRYMNDYYRAWINMLGSVLFLIPFCLLVIYSSWPFVLQSFQYMEGSPDPGGLPYRWILKAVIPLGFIFLLIHGIADFIRNLNRILEKT